jgi:uncharacterized membrane protein
VFGRPLRFGGLVGALVFFCLSMSPSLLPRGVVLQGIIGGVAGVIGYGFGSLAAAVVDRRAVSEPASRSSRVRWWVLLIGAVVLVPLSLAVGAWWQNDVRHLMGMEPLAAWEWGVILLVALVTAAVLLLICRGVRGFARVLVRWIDRFLSRWVSVTIGVAVTTLVVIGLIQGFVLEPALAALNSAYSTVNDGTSEGVSQPTSSDRSGSPASLVPWDTLGVQGRDFTGVGAKLGPTRQQLSDFNGTRARDPIRVYVGLKSADSLDARVELAMRELDRTHAWSRKAIAVFTTTGTGWVDERAASPLEYMYNGDTALVGLQYSYLPSWISFLVDVQKAADAGSAMIHAVRSRLSTMPADSRPKLLLFGESLGSYGTEQAFANVKDLISSTDGALLVGPVFRNHLHNVVTDERESGSPFWRPVYDDGANIRFAVTPHDLAQPDTPWESPRVVYLQNSSDPITYWRFDLIWHRPEWLADPRGPDVSSHMFWVPVLTFWGTLGDMVFSTGVPPGHGHDYGANPVDAWAAITRPVGWTAEKTTRVRDIVAGK